MKKLIILLAYFISLPTLAHSLFAVAQYDGKTLSGKAYYSDQTPAKETYFEVFSGDNEKPMLAHKTDQDGRFSLPIATDQPLKVVVEGMEGHRVEVLAQPLTNQLEHRELALIREEIHQLKNKIWFRDILGGLGYIVGIFGLIVFLKNRK